MTTRSGPRTTETGQIVPAKEARHTIEAWLRDDRMHARLKALLPAVIPPARFVEIALTSLRRNPKLLSCEPQSLLRCMMQAAMVGLEIDNSLGHAYLVPFKQEVTLILGYRGLVQLMHRTGVVSSISAQVVREGDRLEFELGLAPRLSHRPGEDPEAKITYAYAVIRYKDGSTQFDVMNRKEIDAIRARSRAGASGPWVTDYPEMAKKTVLRRLAKLAPMSVEDQRLVVADELADAGMAQQDALPFVDLPALDVPATEETGADPAEVTDRLREEAPTANGQAAQAVAKPDPAAPEPLPRDPLTPRQIPAGAAGMTDPFMAATQMELAAEKLWPVPVALTFGQWKADRAFLEMARAGWSRRDIIAAVRRAG